MKLLIHTLCVTDALDSWVDFLIIRDDAIIGPRLIPGRFSRKIIIPFCPMIRYPKTTVAQIVVEGHFLATLKFKLCERDSGISQSVKL